tara:strand:+ start:952 stop:1095 length:144 start_codon:yes stop_codon:yes gene_type:complete
VIEELIVMQIHLEELKANGKTKEAQELEKTMNVMMLGVPNGNGHADD